MKSSKNFSWFPWALSLLLLLVAIANAQDTDLDALPAGGDVNLDDPPASSPASSSPPAATSSPPAGGDVNLDDPPAGTENNNDVGCAAVHAVTQNPNAVATKFYGCPDNNGKLFEGSDGHHLYIQCCTERTTGRALGMEKAPNFGACMNLCVQEKTGDCRSVSFNRNAAAGQPNCVLWAQGGFSSFQDTGAHHAFLVDAPTSDKPDDDIKLCSTECPYSNNQVFTSGFGESFRMVCGKRHGTEAQAQTMVSYEECMQACARLGPCKSVDWHPRTKKCYFGEHIGEPEIDAPGFASAYSMGCAGACKEYPKPAPRAPVPNCPNKFHEAKWVIEKQPWETLCTSVHFPNNASYTLRTAGTSPDQCFKLCQDDTQCKWGWHDQGTGKCNGVKTDWSQNTDVPGAYGTTSTVHFRRLTQ
ncbi:hypothetical protein FQN57_002744 [Myotisia sp. PD_48]|nr:hypothetical protein FQN57_002744 [Myotisia sp. PD_48]